VSEGVVQPEARRLAEKLVALFAGGDATEPAIRIEADRVVGLLRALPPMRAPLSRSEHPIVRHLSPALDAAPPAARDAVAAIGDLGRELPWRYSYAPRADAPDLGDRVAFAELVGPDAPFRSGTVCLGLTLIAPHTLYPAHRHPAIELYFVLSGTATWTAGGLETLAPPGTLVLHPSGVSHAMTTRAEPLLAVYTWSGEDVATPSSYS
jgi:quercetin dioxygenase-like cupin family protein